jgi:hypothetical protein
VYYVLAIDGRPVLLSLWESADDALRDFEPLRCPSLVARVEGPAVEVIAIRELLPAQLDGPFLEAVKRVCNRVPSET